MIRKVNYGTFAVSISPLSFDDETGILYIEQKTGCQILERCTINESGDIFYNNFPTQAYVMVGNEYLKYYDIKKIILKKKMGSEKKRYYVSEDGNALMYENTEEGINSVRFMTMDWFGEVIDLRKDIDTYMFSDIRTKPDWWSKRIKKIICDDPKVVEHLKWIGMDEVLVYNRKNWGDETSDAYIMQHFSGVKTKVKILYKRNGIDKTGRIVKR